MKWHVFLDDERDPNLNSFKDRDDFVIVVRSYDAAVFTVSQILAKWHDHDELFIHFDHDLGEFQKTGLDFAKWIVENVPETLIQQGRFDYWVHSMNPVGKANIIGLLDNWIDTIISVKKPSDPV